MSPEQNALRVRVGAVTLTSLLLTMVILAVVLAISDGRASRTGPAQEPIAFGSSDGITAFALASPGLRAVGSPKCVRTANVVHLNTGTDVFVYTRNADGVLTDPD